MILLFCFLQVFVVKIKNFALKFSVQNDVRDIQYHIHALDVAS